MNPPNAATGTPMMTRPPDASFPARLQQQDDHDRGRNQIAVQ
jgi:hypothetical protein